MYTHMCVYIYIYIHSCASRHSDAPERPNTLWAFNTMQDAIRQRNQCYTI